MARACEKVNETMSVDLQSNGQSILSTPSYFGHQKKEKRPENSFNRHICNKQQHLDGLEEAKAFSGIRGVSEWEREKNRFSRL